MKAILIIMVILTLVNLAFAKVPDKHSLDMLVAMEYFNKTGKVTHVTSAYRSPKEQAFIMINKHAAGQNLYKLYKHSEVIDDFLSAYVFGSFNDMVEVIEIYMDKGIYLSKHLCDKAIDVRSRNMTLEEQEEFIKIVEGIPGIEILQEFKPPHFHIQYKGDC